MVQTRAKEAHSVAEAVPRASIDDNGYIPENVPKLPDRYADESYKLFSEVKVTDPTPEEAIRIRNKLLWRIVPFLCIGYHLISAILGILKDAHLNANQYNWLSSIFYFGYMIAEFPQNWALQRFPVAKWLAGNLVICHFASWQWLMFLCGVVTVVFGIFVYLMLPDSPLYAHFLTSEERAQAILRIKSNHSGIEQKHFKREQFIEAIKDPKTWLFTGHALTQEMANGTTNQYSLLINSFGFTVLQTTLLGTVTGAVSFISLASAAIVLYYTKDCRAWISLFAYVPTALSSILLLGLPSNNRWGLITGIWIRSAVGVPYAVVMIWAANASAGHTKKTTVIALYHVAYGLGNIISPQLFRPQWKPRYRPTWIILLVIAAIVPAIIVLTLRIYLDRENKRRDKMEGQNHIEDNGIIETVNVDGTMERQVVDSNQLDLTDRQNLKFKVELACTEHKHSIH
ncbi:hypothetical protein MY5147_006608 [Beauveria neobassiana]